MRAIRTRYLAPTAHRGPRYKAYADAGNSTTIDISTEDILPHVAHTRAAKALCEKLSWHGEWFGGWLQNDMVWVCVDRDFNTFTS